MLQLQASSTESFDHVRRLEHSVGEQSKAFAAVSEASEKALLASRQLQSQVLRLTSQLEDAEADMQTAMRTLDSLGQELEEIELAGGTAMESQRAVLQGDIDGHRATVQQLAIELKNSL